GQALDPRVVPAPGPLVDEAGGPVDVGPGLLGVLARPLAGRLGGSEHGGGLAEPGHGGAPSGSGTSHRSQRRGAAQDSARRPLRSTASDAVGQARYAPPRGTADLLLAEVVTRGLPEPLPG